MSALFRSGQGQNLGPSLQLSIFYGWVTDGGEKKWSHQMGYAEAREDIQGAKVGRSAGASYTE